MCCTISAVSCPVNLWVVSMCYIKPSMWTWVCCVRTSRNTSCTVSCPMFLFALFRSSIPEADSPKCLKSFVIEIELIWSALFVNFVFWEIFSLPYLVIVKWLIELKSKTNFAYFGNLDNSARLESTLFLTIICVFWFLFHVYIFSFY